MIGLSALLSRIRILKTPSPALYNYPPGTAVERSYTYIYACRANCILILLVLVVSINVTRVVGRDLSCASMGINNSYKQDTRTTIPFSAFV